MNVLYDLMSTQPTRSAKFHGGGAYGQRYLAAVLRADLHREHHLSVAYNPAAPHPEYLRGLIESKHIPVVHVADETELLDAAAGHDRFYSPVPYWMTKHARTVRQKLAHVSIGGTIHGLRELDYPEDRYSRLYQPDAAKRAFRMVKKIGGHGSHRQRLSQFEHLLRTLSPPFLTVSEHSKYQLCSEFPWISPADVVVADSFLDFPGPNAETDILARLGLSETSYFLTLNANRPGKNSLRVLAALEEYKPERLRPYRFVMIGFSEAQLSLIRRRFPWASQQMIPVPYLDEDDLGTVYRNAFGLLVSSLSEGFGYPPLEAMHFDIPCLCSAVTALPETAGEAALYFNPYSLSEIVYRLTQFVSDEALRSVLVRAGRKRVQYYLDRRPAMVKLFSDYLFYQPRK
jgi:glycosyltransferase involved in cell wall biosynthesis